MYAVQRAAERAKLASKAFTEEPIASMLPPDIEELFKAIEGKDNSTILQGRRRALFDTLLPGAQKQTPWLSLSA